MRALLPLRGLLPLGALGAVALFQTEAHAQIQYGQIQGTITNRLDGKPIGGVTVVVTGPALQGEQSEITDKAGRYQITQLPPGDGYMVRLYYNDVIVERPGIRIALGKSLTVSAAIPTQRGHAEKIVIRERAPNVDTASANTGVEINQELLRNTAVRGRTFESVISLAPGAADVAPRGVAGGDVGVSFSGSVGNENLLLVDGLNTTELAFGLVSTQVHQYFIKEVNVLSGGYQAEYGRATGGVISVVTNSGSNEFHGSVFASVAPFMATPRPITRLGEAIATYTRQSMQYDLGFDLGGPIVKDKLWFYVGFAPTVTTIATDRALRILQPERDTDYQDPSYLSDPVLTEIPRGLARRTVELDNPQRLYETRRIYNWIAKFQINLHADHQLFVSYIGSPQFGNEYGSGSGYSSTGSSNPFSSELAAGRISRTEWVHDTSLHYIGKLFAKRLTIDVLYGYHYHRHDEIPGTAALQQIRYRAAPENPNSLADFEDIAACRRYQSGGALFNPCPVTDYTRGGFGQYAPYRLMQRHSVQASLTGFLKAAGSHAIKLGLDFEDNFLDNTKKFTGTDFDPNDPYSGRITWETDAAGTGLRINRGYALERQQNSYGQPGTPCGGVGRYCFPDFRAETETRNYGLYLRDSWSTSFLPGLVVNAGLRWEVQELYGADRTKRIGLYDSLAPRVGLAYDFTKKGRSKLYANFSRYYESIPMDLNDRVFSEEGFLRGGGFTNSCPQKPLVPGGRPLPVPGVALGSPCSLVDPRLSGGEYAPVAPGLKGQYTDEVVAGVQFDVGLDIVLGAFYTYRYLGTVVEDLSVDGGNTYFIANPGAEGNPETIRTLDAAAQAAEAMAAQSPNNEELRAAATFARARASVYKATVLFPKPRRDYHAVTLTANKRLSNQFSVLASYTYSRLYGNYPGPFSPYVNQLDPNISSQYDILDLTVNRDGPLNNDRPHNIKVTGFFVQPIKKSGMLTMSVTFTAISGRPLQVLGAHAAYGGRQVLILPNGSGGRTPMVTQFDLHIGYEHKFGPALRASVFGDVLNLFNQREVVNVDEEYTFSVVSPIAQGKPQDLRYLRAADGTRPIVNSNYGQPTAFQAPLMLRFGARLSF